MRKAWHADTGEMISDNIESNVVPFIEPDIAVKRPLDRSWPEQPEEPFKARRSLATWSRS
jgi:hypothetical protein